MRFFAVFLAMLASLSSVHAEKKGAGALLSSAHNQISVQTPAPSNLRADIAVECFGLDGLESRDDVGNPINTVVDFNIGSGNQLIGVGWDVGLRAIDPSWLSEATIFLSDSTGGDTDPNGIALNVGFAEEASGDMDFSSGGEIIDFAANDLPLPTAGPDGILQMQLAEDFVDHPGEADAVYRAAVNPAICAGLALKCSDQAACNAAVAGTDSTCDLIFADSFGDPLPPIDALCEPPTPIAGRLNDTGIDWCANNDTNNLDCPVAGFEGQDGDFGRDALARTGQLIKVGAGEAGFDFTKLDANGINVPVIATSWACVRDNHTGLIWEVKTNDNGLRDKDNTYAWYNPDSSTNGGDPGIQGSCAFNGGTCNTADFVRAVNAQRLCGYNDWRMPTIDELKSIVHLGRRLPTIDTDFFADINSTGDYWSASSVAAESAKAWLVTFGSGFDYESLKTNYEHVRLVRRTE